MFENPRRGRQARNFTINVPKILDLQSFSEQIFSENWRWVPLVILYKDEIFQMQISNALLVTAVHDVKMKLGDNILKYWEAFTWKDETSDNKLSNCSLYFTALQYINNLETKRSYKRTVNLDSYFLKKIYRTV